MQEQIADGCSMDSRHLEAVRVHLCGRAQPWADTNPIRESVRTAQHSSRDAIMSIYGAMLISLTNNSSMQIGVDK